MRKVITYSTFIGAAAIVSLLFVTAKDYSQLALAVILYPGIAFIALNIFPQRTKKEYEVKVKLPINAKVEEISQEPEVHEVSESIEITDNNKRDFLKLLGVAGISVFLLSIFNKKSVPFLGKGGQSDVLKIENNKGKVINPAQEQPLDGYQICEIDDDLISYYGFINKDGAWYIMREDTSNNSFRYAIGDSNFPRSWESRARLKYDYFNNV